MVHRSIDLALRSKPLLLAALVCGCAASPAPPPPAPPAVPVALGERTPDGDGAYAERPATRVLSRGESIVIGAAPPSEPTRPPRHRPVRVSFQRADMSNALRFLADAGGFNVVLQDGLVASVSADLRAVDPYDALVAIAQANGASVRYENRIVVVTHR